MERRIKELSSMQNKTKAVIAVFRTPFPQLTMLSSLIVLASFFYPALPAFANDPVVCLNTSKGPIYIRIFVNMVPNTAGAFLDLVQRGFYSGSGFHRVENWCIQGGGPGGDPNGVFVHESGTTRRLRLEINRNLSHSGPGVVAMARTSDPHSASCQFYITKSQTRFLDGKYAIFGGVVQGMRTVNSIQRGDRIISAEIVNSGGNESPPEPAVETPPPTPQSSGRSRSRSGSRGSATEQQKPMDSGF